MASELRVVSVSIRDVLGAREFALQPGQVTVLEGQNGSGKSTALQAVQAALGGGNLARLARVDRSGTPTEPEVVLVLEGPGNETYRVERAGDKLRVRSRVGDTAGFEDVARPQSWLSSLFDADCANPVRFLTAPDKDRALLLLEALPLKLDRAALLTTMGITAAELAAMGAVPAGLHPLEELAFIREAVFRTRTGVNRDEKQQRASAEQLRRNIPAVPPEDPGGAAQVALEAAAINLASEISRETEAAEGAHRQALESAAAAYRLEEQKVEGSFKTEAAKLRTKHAEQAAGVRADARQRAQAILDEAERQVAEDLASTNGAIEGLRTGGEVVLDEAEDAKAAAVKVADDSLAAARRLLEQRQDELVAAREKLAALKAQREGAAKAGALLEQVTQFDRQADELKAQSERLSEAIDALDAHRRQMAENLPIEGLTIEDKVIRVNGVAFEQLNTAQRVAIAVKVSALRAQGRRLPVVFVDGAEALDRPHFDALVAELKANGLQAFIGRVADHELEVQSVA